MKPSKELIERAAEAGFLWIEEEGEFISEFYEHMRVGELYGQDVYIGDGEYQEYDPISPDEIMDVILEIEKLQEE